MAKRKRYLIPRDEHQYCIDKISVNIHQFSLGNHSTLSKLKYVNDVYEEEIYGVSDKVQIIRKNNGSHFRLLFTFLFNFNDYLRDSLIEDYGKRKGAIGAHVQDNFIPAYIRRELIKDDITLSTLREKAFDNFFNQLSIVKKRVISFFLKKYNVELYNLSTSLCYIEINWDLLTNPGVELAKDRNLRKSLNHVAKEFRAGKFLDKYGNTCFPDSKSSLKSIEDEFVDHSTHGISCKFADNSKGIVYMKEDGKYGAINRLERRFQAKQISKILKMRYPKKKGYVRTFVSKADFKKKISTLAKFAFEGWLKPLNIDIDFDDKSFRKQVRKTLCSRAFFDHLGHKAFKELFLNSQSIMANPNFGHDPRLARKCASIVKNSDGSCPIRRVKQGRHVKYVLNLNYFKNSRF